jgi:trigger factor
MASKEKLMPRKPFSNQSNSTKLSLRSKNREHHIAQQKQMSSDHYTNVKVTSLPAAEVEIEAEIPASVLEAERSKTLAVLNKQLSIPGFRPGKIPEKILTEKVGELEVLEKTAERILPEITYEIIVAKKIESIGRPSITITKIAKGEPVGFKIKTTVFPQISNLPDYKAIAQKVMAVEQKPITIDEKEIDALILELRKNRAYQERLQKNQAANKTDTPNDTAADSAAKPVDEKELNDEKNLPVFDDEFAAKLGDFKTVADFKEKVRENMIQDRKNKEKEKRRLEVIEEVAKKISVEVPALLIDNELQKMWAQFSDDVARMGVTVPQYLEHIKKTEADLKKDWRPDAEKRVRLQLAIDKIAKEEKIEADKELVEKETAHILEHYKEALPDRVRAYTEMMLTNEKVFQFLEQQK